MIRLLRRYLFVPALDARPPRTDTLPLLAGRGGKHNSDKSVRASSSQCISCRDHFHCAVAAGRRMRGEAGGRTNCRLRSTDHLSASRANPPPAGDGAPRRPALRPSPPPPSPLLFSGAGPTHPPAHQNTVPLRGIDTDIDLYYIRPARLGTGSLSCG